MAPPSESYSRGADMQNLRNEVGEFRKRHYDEMQEIRRDTAEWRKQRNEEVSQFRQEVVEIRKAIDLLTRMLGSVEQQTQMTKEMTTREQRQMEQVYFLLRGDNEGRNGILGRLAALEFQTKQLEIRREEIVKDVHERLGHLESDREKVTARVWQLVISAVTGSLAAFALGQIFNH